MFFLLYAGVMLVAAGVLLITAVVLSVSADATLIMARVVSTVGVPCCRGTRGGMYSEHDECERNELAG